MVEMDRNDLDNENVLWDIAKKGKDFQARLEAVEMISNMDILADIAMNATDSKIVSKAIEKINDDSFFNRYC